MSRLNDLYNAMETLRKEGLPVTEELEESVNQLEEDIIKKEILPILSKTIEPALKPVQRELVLVVDYKPEQPISLHLSRKQNFTADILDAKEILIDPEVVHGTRGTTADNIKRSIQTSMSVHFPDGTTIAENTAADTLLESVKKIGVELVRMVVEEHKLVFSKVPVISNRRDDKYGKSQRELGGGWLLITHSNNSQKKKFLDKVSKALNLGLRVELKEK